MIDLIPSAGMAAGLMLVGALAGVIRGLTGFGAALVTVPGLTLFMAPEQAVATNLLALTATNAALLHGARKEADYRTVGLFMLACVPALPLGVHLLTALPAEVLTNAIGISVIVASLLLARPRFRLASAGVPLKLAAGGASGVMGGAVGMAGPPVILLLLALPIPPAVARASLILFFTLQNMVLLAILLWAGLVDAQTGVWAVIVGLPLVLAGRVGELLFRRGWSNHFRPIAIGVLVLTGIAAILG